MPRQYKLRYLPLFWDDFAQAALYIRDTFKNFRAAQRLVDQTERAILNHLQNPTIAPLYKTTREHPLPYYWFAVGNYMVFYVVDDDVMEIRRFIYGSRDLTRIVP